MKNCDELIVFVHQKTLYGLGIIRVQTQLSKKSLSAFCSSPLEVDTLREREKELASGLSGLECVEFILDELILTPLSLHLQPEVGV